MTGPSTTHRAESGHARLLVLFYLLTLFLIITLVFVRLFFHHRYILPLIVLLSGSGIFYAGAVYLIIGRRIRVPRAAIIVIIVLSIVLRLLFFTSSPEVLSDDVYRYFWDGKVQANGINPYLYPPESSELTHLRDDSVYPLVNHKEFRTSYPPVSQYIFRAAYEIGKGRLLPLRVFYILMEGIIAAFLLLMFRQMKRGCWKFAAGASGRDSILIYLLCPLVIVEVYGGMHIDIAGIALFVASCYFFSTSKYYPFLLLFTLSVFVKYVPIVTAPLFIIAYRKRDVFAGRPLMTAGDLLLKAVLFFTLAFLLFLPFRKAGGLLFEQLTFYVEYWQFNGGFYRLLQRIFGNSARWIRLPLLAAVIAAVAVFKNISLRDKIVLTLMLFTVLGAAVYPWYFLWYIPFLVFQANKGELSLIILIFLSYYILGPYKLRGIWEERPLFLFLQWVPFFLLFFHDIFTGKYVQRKKDRRHHSRP